MRYSVMCYGAEGASHSLSQDEDDRMMAELAAVEATFPKNIKIRAGLRLMPTTAATSVRYGRDTLVVDGPFAETKEHLLGFYVIECETLEQALDAANLLAGPRMKAGLIGTLEVRPIMMGYVE